MIVTAWRKPLIDCFAMAERATAKAATLPSLQHVLVSAEKGFLEVSATDLQLGIVCRFPAKVEREGRVVVPARFVLPPLQMFEEEQVVLGIEEKKLLVSSKQHRVLVNTLDPEEFPIIPTGNEAEEYLEGEGVEWCRGLNQVVGVAGQSQARPEISGVLVAIERRAVRLVATDSFRLAEKTILLEKESDGERSFILPQKTARELIGILGEKPGKMKICASATQATFDYTKEQQAAPLRVLVVSRIIEGEYPKYEEVIPSAKKTTIRASRAELLNHVKAAGIFAGKTNEVRVAADPKAGEVSFSAQNNEAGEHTSTMRAEVAGESGRAAFNWRFLSEGLVHAQGETIECALNGEDGAALLGPADQEGYRYVIMPIKA